MKHYLDLIAISAGRHKKQTRMTRLCIVLAVFLVTVIFGMADMEMRAQMIQAVKSDGNWHAGFVVDAETGALIGERPEVERIARYGVVNYGLQDGYRIGGVETCVCGLDADLLEMFPAVTVLEGRFPQQDDEAMLNEAVKSRLGLRVGDLVSLTVPRGESRQYRITGITKDMILTAEHDAFGMLLTAEGYDALHTGETDAGQEMVYFVQFKKFCNIQKAIGDISTQFGLAPEQVRQNAKVLMLMFQSGDSYLMKFYFVAAVLAVLVAVAGIFMIAASMNSNIARRTEFFGMMRCLGATKRQVICFVKREALGWCRLAVPAGLLAGVVTVWAACGMLRLLSPGLFDSMPVLGVSFLSLVAGTLIGLVTVLLAAGAPAKKAAGVSPLTAVSGNAGTVQAAKRAADTRVFKVDTALGVHHAAGSRRNFFLVTGSFAFSIILFLAFGTAIDFMHHAIMPLRPQAPDFYAFAADYANIIPAELAEQLQEHPGVKRAFGRGYAQVTAQLDGQQTLFTILSYDAQQFRWAGRGLLKGNLADAEEGKGVLLAWREEGQVPVGSKLTLSVGGEDREVSVVGILGDVPFSHGTAANTGSSEVLLICSEALFRDLTGETGYAVLDMQMEQAIEETEVQQIRKKIEQACGSGISFADKRLSNQEVKGASYSLSVFLYGFLVIIAMLAFFNIINCIAMSVSARMREYGVMRAIGMSVRQLVRMIVGETLAYMVSGAVFGCLIGLPINRILFEALVTSRWGEAWEVPVWELAVIVAVMGCALCLAVAGPARQIRQMTVVDTIGEAS